MREKEAERERIRQGGRYATEKILIAEYKSERQEEAGRDVERDVEREVEREAERVLPVFIGPALCDYNIELFRFCSL
jgi:hypothetical protein